MAYGLKQLFLPSCIEWMKIYVQVKMQALDTTKLGLVLYLDRKGEKKYSSFIQKFSPFLEYPE